MNPSEIKTIRVSKKIHNQIKKLREVDDSMEDVLEKLLKYYTTGRKKELSLKKEKIDES